MAIVEATYCAKAFASFRLRVHLSINLCKEYWNSWFICFISTYKIIQSSTSSKSWISSFLSKTTNQEIKQIRISAVCLNYTMIQLRSSGEIFLSILLIICYYWIKSNSNHQFFETIDISRSWWNSQKLW